MFLKQTMRREVQPKSLGESVSRPVTTTPMFHGGFARPPPARDHSAQQASRPRTKLPRMGFRECPATCQPKCRRGDRDTERLHSFSDWQRQICEKLSLSLSLSLSYSLLLSLTLSYSLSFSLSLPPPSPLPPSPLAAPHTHTFAHFHARKHAHTRKSGRLCLSLWVSLPQADAPRPHHPNTDGAEPELDPETFNTSVRGGHVCSWRRLCECVNVLLFKRNFTYFSSVQGCEVKSASHSERRAFFLW